jgi:hypothetical protein
MSMNHHRRFFSVGAPRPVSGLAIIILLTLGILLASGCGAGQAETGDPAELSFDQLAEQASGSSRPVIAVGRSLR